VLRERGSNFILHVICAGREARLGDPEVNRVNDTVFTVYFDAGFKPGSAEHGSRITGFAIRKRGTEAGKITRQIISLQWIYGDGPAIDGQRARPGAVLRLDTC
jgi:hypothetical protein